MSQSQDIEVGKDLEVLTFDLQGETFALEALLVREVLDKAPETKVPGAPAFVDAVINFRGKIIPLADLRVAFLLGRSEETIDSRVIVIEHELDGEAALIGLRADKVHEVAVFKSASTEAAPRLGTAWRADFINCVAKAHGDIVIVPELSNIFAAHLQSSAGQSSVAYAPRA